MPAAVEILADGQAAFYAHREPAWHRLGTITPDALTAGDALRAAHLSGWDITKQPIGTITPSGNPLVVEGKYATVRTTPSWLAWADTDPRERGPEPQQYDTLGVVGDDYTIIQNEAAFEFLNGVVSDGDATFATAGSLRDGKRVFVTMEVPERFHVTADDTISTYIAVATGHDGTFAFRAFPTPVRIVCQNTLSVAMGSASRVFTIRHNPDSAPKLEAAREALRVAVQGTERLVTAAREMLDVKITDKEFDKIVAANFLPLAEDATPAKAESVEKRRAEIRLLFRQAPTQESARGTAWGAYNAITEWQEWVAPRNPLAVGATESVLTGARAQQRQKAWNLLAPTWARA